MRPLLMLALACRPDAQSMRRGGPETDAGGAEDTATLDTGDSGGLAGCPSGMVDVDGSFCIDACEASLEERDTDGAWVAASPYETVAGREVRAVVACGDVPQGYISGDEAAAACAAAGKRLCATDEWLDACQGPDGTTWPYGDTYMTGACNDTYAGGHPVIDYFGSDDVWDMDHMNDPGINQQPGTVAPGADYVDCVSARGAWDMHGNLHEWVDDADGTFRGGFYADAEINGPGCTYRTTAHPTSYHDYSTGFRCCADGG